MIKSRKISIDNFFTKAIIFNLYLFAFGLFTSKALTSISGGLICIFGLLRFLLLRENPFKSVKNRTINLSILFFIGALFLSIAGRFTFRTWSCFEIYLLMIVFFYTAVSNLQSLKQVKNLLLLSLTSLVIVTCYGFYQKIFLNVSRINGFSSPLDFGNVLAITLTYLLIFGFWGKIKLGYRITAFISSICLGANLLFTQTRGAWLAAIGGLITLSWVKNKKLLILIILVFLVLYFILPENYITRFESSFDVNTNSSNLQRIDLWKSAISMFRDHFIKGIGLGRYSLEYATNYRPPHSEFHTHAHSNLMQFMAETGIIGLTAFVWLMVAISIWLYKSSIQITDHNWGLFLLGSFCSTIIYNIYGLTYFNFGDAETLRFFWFLTALNVGVVNLADTNATK